MAHVVILAAGYATRLYPLTENFPKPLLEVGGKPIINHLLDALQPISKEISGVACVTNDLYTPHFEKWAKELNAPFPVSVVNDGTRTNDTRLGAIRDTGLRAESFNNNDDLMLTVGQFVILDGNHGLILVDPDRETIDKTKRDQNQKCYRPPEP